MYVDQVAGDRNQLIVPRFRTQSTLAKRNHRPLTVVADSSLVCSSVAGVPRVVKWDVVRLSNAVRFSKSKQPFFAKFEAELLAKWNCCLDQAPDIPMANLVNMVIRIGLPFWAVGKGYGELLVAKVKARNDWNSALRERTLLIIRM